MMHGQKNIKESYCYATCNRNMTTTKNKHINKNIWWL